MRPLDTSKIHNILVISLSNIGDVVLTLPVADILKRDFPQARVSMVVGPKAESLLKNSPAFDHVHIYDKHQPRREKIRWILKLRRERYDLAVDLRNSAIPFLIGARWHTPLHWGKTPIVHMKTKHLNRLKTVHSSALETEERNCLQVPAVDQAYVQECLKKQINSGAGYVVMAPGSADQAKRWSKEGFARVADVLFQEHGLQTIFLGDQNDNIVVEQIHLLMKTKPVNLCGQSTLIQTAEFIRRCKLAVVNDSAALHIASYLNKPVIGLFGYSDPAKYGPWSKTGIFLRAKGKIVTRENSTQEKVEFIESIKPEEVLRCIRVNAGEVSLPL